MKEVRHADRKSRLHDLQYDLQQKENDLRQKEAALSLVCSLQFLFCLGPLTSPHSLSAMYPPPLWENICVAYPNV